jgi:hypothetical protein
LNVGQIFGAISKRVDDTTASGTPALDNVYWSLTEGFCAVNEAQNMFALLTLCLETSGTVPLTAGRCFYGIRGYLPGYLLPLRVTVGGARIQPAKLTDLDARYFAWPAVSGTPAKYCQIGMNLFAIVPQPAGNSSAVVAYAKEPAVLWFTGDVPEIPEEYHQALAKYAAYYLLQKRGGQYLQLAVDQWGEFLADASQCADYVRRRNRARQYDNEPAEIRLPVQKEGALTNG